MAKVTVGEPPEEAEVEVTVEGAPGEDPRAEPEPDSRVWATSDFLGGTEPWVETQLPILQQWVKVRYLGTEDVTPLQYLPDYAGFIELCLKLAGNRAEQEEVNPVELEQETIRYQAHIVHLAIIDPSVEDENDTQECWECATHPELGPAVHLRSLLTVKQARRMPSPDLEHVAEIALQADRVLRMRPFSEALAEVVSQGRVVTGGLTQPTS